MQRFRYQVSKTGKKVRKEWEKAKQSSADRKAFVSAWSKDPAFGWIISHKSKELAHVKQKKRRHRWWEGFNKIVRPITR